MEKKRNKTTPNKTHDHFLYLVVGLLVPLLEVLGLPLPLRWEIVTASLDGNGGVWESTKGGG